MFLIISTILFLSTFFLVVFLKLSVWFIALGISLFVCLGSLVLSGDLFNSGGSGSAAFGNGFGAIGLFLFFTVPSAICSLVFLILAIVDSIH